MYDTVERVVQRLRDDPETAGLLKIFEGGIGLVGNITRFVECKETVEESYRKAKRSLLWQSKNRPFDVTPEDVIVELTSGKVRCLGMATNGVQFYSVRAADHFAASEPRGHPRESTAKLMYALLRHAEDCSARESQEKSDNAQPNAGKIGVVFDMDNFGRCNIDRGVLKELGGLVSKYFPGRIHVCYVVNVSMFGRGLWYMIRILVKTKWLELINFLSDPAELVDAIDIDLALWPREYGGNLELDEEAWIDASATAISRNLPYVAPTRQSSTPSGDAATS